MLPESINQLSVLMVQVQDVSRISHLHQCTFVEFFVMSVMMKPFASAAERWRGAFCAVSQINDGLGCVALKPSAVAGLRCGSFHAPSVNENLALVPKYCQSIALDNDLFHEAPLPAWLKKHSECKPWLHWSKEDGLYCDICKGRNQSNFALGRALLKLVRWGSREAGGKQT